MLNVIIIIIIEVIIVVQHLPPGEISVGGILDREDMAEFNLIVQV